MPVLTFTYIAVNVLLGEKCFPMASWLQAHAAESHEESAGREGAGKSGDHGCVKVALQIARMILKTQSGGLLLDGKVPRT